MPSPIKEIFSTVVDNSLLPSVTIPSNRKPKFPGLVKTIIPSPTSTEQARPTTNITSNIIIMTPTQTFSAPRKSPLGRSKIGGIIGASLASCILLVCLGGYIFWKKRAKRFRSEHVNENNRSIMSSEEHPTTDPDVESHHGYRVPSQSTTIVLGSENHYPSVYSVSTLPAYDVTPRNSSPPTYSELSIHQPGEITETPDPDSKWG
ncbi:hypothetical protein BDZ94DRAFT_1310453 [Collybia nuda]|uniref:Uncharacterized protein n=1 Tax=Collybia nuda TaxID=64659 RepID=A0A9P5Y179_9AGAR|nr:hypothetical protein BDZ94DRAFT_1310453 [Collybia nuda]